MSEHFSTPLAYAHDRLDRASDRRQDPAWIEHHLHAESSLFLPLWRYRHAVRPSSDGPEAVMVRRADADGFLEASELVVFLGLHRGEARFAVDLPSHDEGAGHLPDPFEDLRKVGPLLPETEASLLAYARGMVYWHRYHGFCSRCGSPTEIRHGGHLRRCTDPGCGRQSFPRTDPAVIMLVEHRSPDGPARCLLGRGPKWPPGSFSTLAGFVEPGESLEQTVAREVAEEAGVEIPVSSVVYRGSQPWPFPSSLMLGFRARAVATELRLDPQELADAAWFRADELRTFGEWGDESSPRRLPRKDSIARRLIDEWITEQP